MVVGLTARAINKWAYTRKGPRPSLLRQAIIEQLTPQALMQPKMLLGTDGSDTLAFAALAEAQAKHYTLVVCFVRQVSLSYKYESRQALNLDTDLGALKEFSKILDEAHDMKEAMLGCEKVLIGTSRQGALYHLIKGTFQQRLESILPPEIPVEVITPQQAEEAR